MFGEWGFNAISDIMTNNNWQMRVIVEGRRPHYWVCRQQGHLAQHSPQKAGDKLQNPPAPAALPIAPSEKAPENDSAQNEWTKVVRSRKGGKSTPPK